MRKILNDIKNHKFFVVFVMVILLLILYKVSDYIPGFFRLLKNSGIKLLDVSKPIIIAIILSYILKPLIGVVDRLYFRLFYKIDKTKNPTEILSKKQFARIRLLTVITVILVLSVLTLILILFILQPFIKSLSVLIKEWPVFVNIITEFFSKLQFDQNIMNNITKFVTNFMNTNLSELLNVLVSSLTTFVSNTGIFIFNFLVAVILSVYILRDKEKIGRFFSTLLDLIFPKKFSTKVKNFSIEFDKIFSGYFTGVIVDSIFVGICSFALTAIIKNEYSIIIGVLAGVSNVIPYFGPLIGAIGAFILGIPSGLTVAILGFALLMIFQQIEGNLIQPKILGDFVGLPPLVVIISIIIGGGLFGISGIILASPVVGISALYYKRYLKRNNIEL